MHHVLVLTPIKDAVAHLDAYFANLARLTYPREHLSLGLLEGDSRDGTFEAVRARLAADPFVATLRRANSWKKDFGFRLPPGVHRAYEPVQLQRRAILARARNHLLMRALDDEDFVLWLDADVAEYPADVIERLLATGKNLVHPHCVLDFGGPSFDTNAWRDRGRLHLHHLRGEGELVHLDAVGGTMLLVRADLHRDGLVFPPFPYGRAHPAVREGREGEIETEGLGLMAQDMGVQPWGMPHLEIRHART